MADIPINAVHRRIQYTSTGSAGPYSFAFAILDEGDLAVYDSTTLKTLTTHYTVSLGSAGTGSITFTSGNEPTSGNIVTITSDQAVARTSDFTTGGDFKAATINDELDRITIIQQQLESLVRRCIQLDAFANRDISDSGAGPLAFPYDSTPADQANKFILFDSAGTALTTSSTIALPSSLSDEAANMIRVNSGETAYEFQTPTQVLSALLATESAGIVTLTDGDGTVVSRTITGTANEITVANGDGVSGNPTLSLPASISATSLTLSGDLTVNGSTITMDATNTVIKDPLIELNTGASSNANDLGLLMERGSTGDNAFLGWDESGDYFVAATTTATGSSTGNISYSFAPFKCSAITATSGTLAGITSLGLSAGATITAGILDEDAMGSNSAVALATQQSIKAYSDNNALAPGFPMTWEADVDAGDKGNGRVWLNHATPASATLIYLDDFLNNGTTAFDTFVASLDDPTHANSAIITVHEGGQGGAFVAFKVSGAVVDLTTHQSVAITHIATVGSFTDGDTVGVTVAYSGDDAGLPAGIGDLSDVTITSPATGAALTYNGSAWVDGTIAGGGGWLGESGVPNGDSSDIIRVNEQTLNNSQTMIATDNGSATGPLSIASGVTLTISSGATFVVI